MNVTERDVCRAVGAALTAILLVACAGADGGADTGRSAGRDDSPPGSEVDASSPEGEMDAGMLAVGTTRGEVCGNGFDDDGDGEVDEAADCACAVGTERPCWPGPPDSRGVGACLDGVQRCRSDGATATWSACEEATVPVREVIENGTDDDCDGTTDEPDGVCRPTEQLETGCTDGRDDDCDTLRDCDDPDCAEAAGCAGGCDATETLCWGGIDDDCDGATDCDDPDCGDNPSCDDDGCPPGEVPTYFERDLGTDPGPSGIRAGDGQPRMPMSCAEGDCPRGNVQVAFRDGTRLCVPPPEEECEDGNHATYVASGVWRCDPPCELIIHYGHLFSGRNVCAGNPDLSCPGDEVPTFDEPTESWVCRTRCNNGLYDRILLDGRTVCVPC